VILSLIGPSNLARTDYELGLNSLINIYIYIYIYIYISGGRQPSPYFGVELGPNSNSKNVYH